MVRGAVVVVATVLAVGCVELGPAEDDGDQRGTFTGIPTFSPLPYQDRVKGRNSFAYEPALDRPTDVDREHYVAAIKELAIAAQQQHHVPACLIGGMAVVEGGYGFTRLAYFANNLFALKYWNPKDPSGATSGVATWQLKGQPDEAWDGSAKVIANHGPDRLVFEESKRYDNRYRAFADHAAAVAYLAGTTLQAVARRPFVDNYWIHRKAGMGTLEACKQIAFELAAPSKPGVKLDASGNDEYYQVSWYDADGKRRNGGGAYCHLGGAYYRKVVGGAIERLGMQLWNDEAEQP